jgi:hypothetical protein
MAGQQQQGPLDHSPSSSIASSGSPDVETYHDFSGAQDPSLANFLQQINTIFPLQHVESVQYNFI